MTLPRRLPSWLLIVATTAMCVAALQLEAANMFPLWRLALQWTPSALPSTGAVTGVEMGLPTFSLVLDEVDLRDPGTGLLPNKMEHGPEWERPGSVSYFEGGRLLFASGVGVRIHGGGSRITSPAQGFRLYFRRRYGAREFAPGILFGPDAQPIRRLIVHNDVRRDADDLSWHLVNPFAYDIADAMGAVTADTQPVRFFLNGEYHGVFVLTERFDERYFAAHWGYDDVLISQEEFDGLWDWVSRTRPLTMEAVGEQVDLDNLTRWFLAIAFCATRDAYQGPGQFLDLSRTRARWFWVNWDMDLSFRNWDLDSYQYLLEVMGEARRGRNRAEPRAVLLTHLLAEDARYREHFKRTFQRIMNHRVTEAFLEERYEHYADEATRFRVEHLDYLPRLRQFIDRRPAFFRQITEQWLNSPPSQPLTLLAPGDVSLLVEGERVRGGYHGDYFPDLDIVLDVPPEYVTRFTGWVVNGRPAALAPRLTLKVVGPVRVEALFGNRSGEPAAAAASAARPSADTLPSPRPAAAWKPIPAGTAWIGCERGIGGCGSDDMPRQQVRIDEAFEMMAREVSAGEFEVFAAASGTRAPRQPWYSDASHPVVNVTFDEAQAYCNWAGGRLPTEAQWEYAARGQIDGRVFPWGDAFGGEGNARGSTGPDRWPLSTAPVGSFAPNGIGLHDIAGNVWEWTASLYKPDDESFGEKGYELRTIRGGSWINAPARLRVTYRLGLSRRGRHNLYVGFRCLRTPFLQSR